mgnify:FL=1
MPHTLLPGSTRCYPLALPDPHIGHSLYSSELNKDLSEWQRYLYKEKYQLNERIGSSTCISRSSIVVHGGMVLNILDNLINVMKENEQEEFPMRNNHAENLDPSDILTSENIQKAWLQYVLSHKRSMTSSIKINDNTRGKNNSSDKKSGKHHDTINDCISNQLFQLDLISRKWTHVTTYIEDDAASRVKPRMCHAMVADEHFLYCFGGLVPTSTDNGDQILLATNELWELDLNTKTWALLSPRQNDSTVPKRYNHAMHVIYEKKKANPSGPVESNLSTTNLDASSLSSSSLPSYNEQSNVKTRAVEEYTKKLVIIGGLNSFDKRMDTVDVFNLETKQWESIDDGLYSNLGTSSISAPLKDQTVDDNVETESQAESNKNQKRKEKSQDGVEEDEEQQQQQEEDDEDSNETAHSHLTFNVENSLSFAFSKNKAEVPAIVVYERNENNPLTLVPLNNKLQQKANNPFHILTSDSDSKLKTLNRQLRFPKGDTFGLNLIISGYCKFNERESALANKLNHNIIYPKSSRGKRGSLLASTTFSRNSVSDNDKQQETFKDEQWEGVGQEFLEFRCFCYNILTGKWIELNTSCIDNEVCANHLISNSFIWESHHKALFVGARNSSSMLLSNALYAPLLQKFDHILSVGLTVTSLFHPEINRSSNTNLNKTHKYLLENMSFSKSTQDLNTKNVLSIFDGDTITKENYSNLKRYKEYAEYLTPTSDLTANNSVLPPYAMVLGKASLSIYADKISDVELVSSDGKSTWCSLVLLRKRWGRYFDSLLAQSYTAACNDYDTNSGKNSKFSSVSTTGNGLNHTRLHHTNSITSLLKERQVSKSSNYPVGFKNSVSTIHDTGGKQGFHPDYDNDNLATNTRMLRESREGETTRDFEAERYKDFSTQNSQNDFASGNDGKGRTDNGGNVDEGEEKEDEEEPIGSPLSRQISGDANSSSLSAMRKNSTSAYSTAAGSHSSDSMKLRPHNTTSSSSGMVFRVPFPDNSSEVNANEVIENVPIIKNKSMASRKISESQIPALSVGEIAEENFSPTSSRSPSITSETPSSLTSHNLTSHNRLTATRVKPLSSVTISASKLPPATKAPTDIPAQTMTRRPSATGDGSSIFNLLHNLQMQKRRNSSIKSIDLISEKSSLRNSPFNSRRSSIDRVFLDRRRSSLSDIDYLANVNMPSISSQQPRVSPQQVASCSNQSQTQQQNQPKHSIQPDVTSPHKTIGGSVSSQYKHDPSIAGHQRARSLSMDGRSASSVTFESVHSFSSSINSELEPLMIPRLLYMPWTNASVDAFVEFFYTGQVNPKWPLQPVSLDVFVMAKLYDVPLLYDLMSEVVYSIIGKKEASLTETYANLHKLYLNAVGRFFSESDDPSEMNEYLESNADYQDLLRLEESLKSVDDGYLDYELLKKASKAVSFTTETNENSSRVLSTASRFSKGSIFGSYMNGKAQGQSNNDVDNPIFRKNSDMRFGSADSIAEYPTEIANVSPKSSISKPSSNLELKLTALKNVSSLRGKKPNFGSNISKIDEYSDENTSLDRVSISSSQEESTYATDESISSTSSSSTDSTPTSPIDKNSSERTETLSGGNATHSPTNSATSFKDKYGFGLVSINKASKRLQQQYVEESVDPLTPMDDGNIPKFFPDSKTAGARPPSKQNKMYNKPSSKGSKSTKAASKNGRNHMLTLEMLASPRSKPPVDYTMELIYDTTVYLYDIVLMVRCRNCMELTKSLKNIRIKLNHEIIMLDTYSKSKRQAPMGVVDGRYGNDSRGGTPTAPATPETNPESTKAQHDPKLLKALLTDQHRPSMGSVNTGFSADSGKGAILSDESGSPRARRNVETKGTEQGKANIEHLLSKPSSMGSKLSQVAQQMYHVRSEGSNHSDPSLLRNVPSTPNSTMSVTPSQIPETVQIKRSKSKPFVFSSISDRTPSEAPPKKKSTGFSFFGMKKKKPKN